MSFTIRVSYELEFSPCKNNILKFVEPQMTVVNSQTKSDKGAGFIQMDDDGRLMTIS